MKAAVISINVFADVTIQDVEPHLAEVILSSYAHDMRTFAPDRIRFTWMHHPNGSIDWPAAEVTGRCSGKGSRRSAFATVKLSQDENGETGHWPAYVRAAFRVARKAVRFP